MHTYNFYVGLMMNQNLLAALHEWSWLSPSVTTSDNSITSPSFVKGWRQWRNGERGKEWWFSSLRDWIGRFRAATNEGEAADFWEVGWVDGTLPKTFATAFASNRFGMLNDTSFSFHWGNCDGVAWIWSRWDPVEAAGGHDQRLPKA